MHLTTSALNKTVRTTHMKNLDIYRETLKKPRALFYLLFLEQQPFTFLSICCTMEMLIVTLRLYLIFYCKPLRQCIHISCPFTVQFTWRQKQGEFVSDELLLFNRHFPAHLQKLPKGKSRIEISIFFPRSERPLKSWGFLTFICH